MGDDSETSALLRRATNGGVGALGELLILEVDAEGRGEGQLMLGADFQWDEEKNQVVITNFASEPVRLTSVRLR